MLGELRTGFEKITDVRFIDYLILVPLIVMIFGIGIFPQPLFNIVEASADVMQNLLTPVNDVISVIAH
jgi:NADH:ubiquinone oxidoreductase subunit 4 (subunit M)